MSTYSIAAAGEIALRIVQREESASVMGLTSRGIFCSTESGRIFFLSYEVWRGPLTINLDLNREPGSDARFLAKKQRSHPQSFDKVIHGSAVRLFPGGIHFEGEGITITTKDISAWKAAIRPLKMGELADARARLENVARLVLAEGIDKGWIVCIPRWAGIDFQIEKDEALIEVEDELQHLSDGLRASNNEEILVHTARLIGRGSGLTPSGDDFLIGLLLGLRTTSEISPVWARMSPIFHPLIDQARHKTTTLAANLIACGVDGQADERLISALDGILTGSLPESECARRLIDYGSSSGGDTLLGMAMALSLG